MPILKAIVYNGLHLCEPLSFYIATAKSLSPVSGELNIPYRWVIADQDKYDHIGNRQIELVM